MQLILAGDTPVIRFVMVSADDNQTADEAATPTVKILKPGGSTFTAVTNSVAHVDNGVYQVTLTATETDTAGFLWLECEATGDAVTRREYQIVDGLEDFISATFDVTMAQTDQDDLADTIWRRSLTDVVAATGKDSKGRYTPLAALQTLIGVVSESGGVVTVKEPNGTTTLASWNVTTNASADLVTART